MHANPLQNPIGVCVPGLRTPVSRCRRNPTGKMEGGGNVFGREVCTKPACRTPQNIDTARMRPGSGWQRRANRSSTTGTHPSIAPGEPLRPLLAIAPPSFLLLFIFCGWTAAVPACMGSRRVQGMSLSCRQGASSAVAVRGVRRPRPLWWEFRWWGLGLGWSWP